MDPCIKQAPVLSKPFWIIPWPPAYHRLDCMYIILSEYESVQLDIWPQNKCRSLWPIFHGPVIVPYTLKTISCMNINCWDYESVWPNAWPQNKRRSPWPIFPHNGNKAKCHWSRDSPPWNGLPSICSHFQTWISLRKLASLYQILCAASLEWGKGCISIWDRSDQIHGSRKGPLTYNWENNVSTLMPSVLIQTSSNLQVTGQA